MSDSLPTPSSLGSLVSDPALIELVEELVQRVAKGDSAVESFLAQHPTHRDRLRALLPALAGLAGLAESPPLLGERQTVGEYRIIRKIGQGGMGAVYEAEQTALGRRVALKVLLDRGDVSPVFRERFQREAKAAALLHHTNIVPVFGVGEHDGVLFYAMQFIRGQPLDKVLRTIKERRRATGARTASPPTDGTTATAAQVPRQEETGKEDPATAASGPTPADGWTPAGELPTLDGPAYFRGVARVGVQAVRALAYAHGQGILHRDVKPSNLLVDERGTLWVADFGLAKLEGSGDLTASGEVVGTLRYMAPERFKGEGDARSDVYGLGVTLYEMLVLRPAFDETNRARLLEHILRDTPPRLRAVDSSVPYDLETVVLKAIDRDPRKRYQNADELADDLERFLADQPIRARRYAWPEQAWRWCKRNPAWASAVGAGLLALVVLVVAVVQVAHSRDQEADARQKAQRTADENRILADHNARLVGEEQKLRRDAERENARLIFDESYRKCLDGYAVEGVLRLAQDVGRAARAGAPELERSVRLHLAAWGADLRPLVAVTHIPMPFTRAVFSADGKQVLVGGEGESRIFDVETGKPIGRPLPHRGQVLTLAFSPDGKRVLTAGVDRSARLWHASTGEPVARPLPHPAPVLAGAFSPDGKLVATAVHSGFRFWDAATGEPQGLSFPVDSGLYALCFSADGKHLLVSSPGVLTLWDVATRKPVRTTRGSTSTTSLALSADESVVLLGGRGDDTKLHAFDEERYPTTLRHTQAVWAVALTPDRRLALTGCEDGMARVWEVPTWRTLNARQVGPALTHAGPVVAVAFRPDQTIVTAGKDQTVRVWRTESGRPFAGPMPHGSVVTALSYSADGSRLLVGTTDGTARCWDARSGKPAGPVLPHPARVRAAALSPDGRTAITGCQDSKLRLWRPDTGELLATPQLLKHGCAHVDMLPDGQACLLTDGTGAVFRFALDTHQPSQYPWARYARPALRPDGRAILGWGGQTRLLELRELSDGRHVVPAVPVPEAFLCLAFCPDGRTAFVGTQKGAYLWDTTRARPVGPRLVPNANVHSICCSADGSFLAAASAGDVYLWERQTNKQLGAAMHHERVVQVAFCPWSRSFATGDLAARVWPVPAPVKGSPEQVTLWAEVLTGAELGREGEVRVLDAATWNERRRRLQQTDLASAGRVGSKDRQVPPK